MNQLTTQFNDVQAGNVYQPQPQGNVLAQAQSSREMEEVKAQIFMARQFPRNIFQAEQRILDACKRKSLAETAIYRYPRGGQMVEGPSIRLAEVVAQNWGNISFGIKELEQRNGESVAMAYAWDLETNVRQEKVFTVPHSRYTRSKGLVKLTDPRDIYELVANNGARRLRACILGVIPGDIIEAAVQECNKTLANQNGGPLKDRIANALKAFKDKFRVTQEMIEARFGYNAEAFTEYDLVELIKIFNSLKDGMSKVDDWFEKDAPKQQQKSDLAKTFEATKEKETKTEEVEVKPDDNQEIEFDQGELPLE